APRPVVWKVRATWAIGSVEDAIGSGGGAALARLDAEWDSAQRAANHALAAAAEHADPAHQAAAERLRLALLSGAGSEQTKLGYDEEVDYGEAQLRVTGKSPLAADVQTVGLE